jgi:hypothetical protein
MPDRYQGNARASASWLAASTEALMPKGPFLPEEFTPTKFSTAADKAEFGNHFLRFIDAEWAQALFTKDFYHRLSMCFGHIAHCDRATFYETWFTRDQARLRFIEKTLKWPCWGDPEYTFSDVERAIQQEVRKRNYLTRYQLRVAEADRASEMETLRRLEAKYRVQANQAVDTNAITVDVIAQAAPSPAIERTPVQASLF